MSKLKAYLYLELASKIASVAVGVVVAFNVSMALGFASLGVIAFGLFTSWLVTKEARAEEERVASQLMQEYARAIGGGSA